MRCPAPLFAPIPALLLGFGSCEAPITTTADAEAPAALEETSSADHDDSGWACAPERALACGETLAGDTGDWNDGGTDAVDFYAGVVGNFGAPELAWQLHAADSGTVEVAFVDPEPTVLNQDLFVLDADGGCRGEAAVARGFNSVSVEVVAGRSYFLVVDGPAGQAGPFEATVACGDGATLEATAPSGPESGFDRPDPFAPQPDTAEGLVNVSADLRTLLEDGALPEACAQWEQHPEDRAAKLRCGKYRFFYEPMGTDGIPAPLLDWVGGNFPTWAGDGFEGFGLVRDPYADLPRPLGFGTSGRFGLADTLGMTCASCHFGQMPDGRFAVGYPNHRYDYGVHMLALMVGVKAGIPGFDPASYHPDAVAAIQPMIDAFDEDPLLGAGLLWQLLPLLTEAANIPEVPHGVQGQYASWRSGTMDFLIAPLAADDGVHTISRISPLWGIADKADFDAYGTDHAQLGWTGGTRSVLDFARGFVHVGGGDLEQWPDEQLAPLAEYILSLRAPAPPSPPPADAVAQGRAIFDSAGCVDCHAGPRGGGLEIHGWGEIGTDPALTSWGAPDGDGGLCCGLSDFDHAYDTGGIKAPRLVGAWAFERFLHNGALDSLEQLLCLAPRPPSETPPFAATGHEFGCDTLTPEQRRHLVDFLRSL